MNLDGFVSYFRNRMERLREIIGSQRVGTGGMVPNIEALRNCANGREVTVIGMVLNKIVTKNGNIMIVIDDETGEYKIIFMNGSSQKAKALFEKARRIVTDEVIAVNGKMSSPFIIANEIVWPDVPIKERKAAEEDIGIAFVSDSHIGSKKFMEKNFVNFIKWLNGEYGERHDLAGKIKYIVMGGDMVDGIGVYPNQDRDLAIPDIYAQYKLFMDLIADIPDYIHMFVIPGNHDAVQRAEPQPPLTKELLGGMKADNIHMLPNPSFLTLHGIEVLAYHGTSLDSDHTFHTRSQLRESGGRDDRAAEEEAPVADIRRQHNRAQQEGQPGHRQGARHPEHGARAQELPEQLPWRRHSQQRHLAGQDGEADSPGARAVARASFLCTRRSTRGS